MEHISEDVCTGTTKTRQIKPKTQFIFQILKTLLYLVLNQVINIETDKVLPRDLRSICKKVDISQVCWYGSIFCDDAAKFRSQQHCAGVILLKILQDVELRPQLKRICCGLTRLLCTRWRSSSNFQQNIKVLNEQIFILCIRSFASFMLKNLEYTDERDIVEYGKLEKITKLNEIVKLSSSELPTLCTYVLPVVLKRWWTNYNKLRCRNKLNKFLSIISYSPNKDLKLFNKVIGDPYIRDIIICALFGSSKSIPSLSKLWVCRVCEVT